MKNNYYKILVERYHKKEATKIELAVFFKLLSEGKLDSYLLTQMDSDLIETEEKNVSFVVRHYKLISAAAIMLLIITTSSIFYLSRNQVPDDVLSQTIDIANNLVIPDSSQAVLILSDGREIGLTDKKNINISEGDIDIATKENGSIIYGSNKNNSVGTQKSLETKYNTIRTSNGGSIEVLLPDGSKVWLNSLSSITFPLVFDTQKREVSIKGEVFFDVLHANSTPFIVNHKNQVINVLGTQFNVNSYEDEPAIKTTVVQGSVSVKKGLKEVKLLSGHQSVIKTDDDNIEVLKVDLKNIIAWKEGYFRFEQENLQTIMRQISRWYNLEVVFKGTHSSDVFTGRIKRSEKIEDIVKILKNGRIDIRLEDKTLYVEG